MRWRATGQSYETGLLVSRTIGVPYISLPFARVESAWSVVQMNNVMYTVLQVNGWPCRLRHVVDDARVLIISRLGQTTSCALSEVYGCVVQMVAANRS